MDKEHKNTWQAGPSCLFWKVWKARNGRAFRDEMLSIQNLKASFLFLLFVNSG